MTETTGDDRWLIGALCKGLNPDIFVPRTDEQRLAAAAKTICNACAVRKECLEYALENIRYEGVWGGTTQRERRKILRQRRLNLAREEVARKKNMG